MDTQAIGTTSGAAPAATGTTRPQTQTTAVGKPTAPSPQDTKAGQDRTPVEASSDVRTRDPRSLQYQVDKGTQQIVATIVDESNHVVIQQIPDAELLRIAKAIDRMQGFLLVGKA